MSNNYATRQFNSPKTSQKALVIAIIAVFALSIVTAAFINNQNRTASTDYTTPIAIARSEMGITVNYSLAYSCSIAIMDEGQIVYSEGFGTAERARNISANANTLYNIGSVSKTFCATAVMLLVDDGKISLDAPVKNYINDFNMTDPRYENITVRMLLDHTSGLSSTTWVNDIGYEANPNFYSDLLNQLSTSTLNANPGEYGPYCNEGYSLAELLVSRVSGESYFDFLNQRIIKPLSLYNTGLCVGEQTGKNIAYYYRPDGTQVPPEVLSLVGAGGLSSTAEDLVRFADSFSVGGKHILSQSSIDEVIKPQLSTFAQHSVQQTGVNPEFYYGLGLDIAGLPTYQTRT